MIEIRDHGGNFGGGKAGINADFSDIFAQLTAPTSPKVGDVWVKVDGFTGATYISNKSTMTGITVKEGDLILLVNVQPTNSFLEMDIAMGNNAKSRLVIEHQQASWNLAVGKDRIKLGSIKSALILKSGKYESHEAAVYNGTTWDVKALGEGYLYRNGVGNDFVETGFTQRVQDTIYQENADHIYLYAKYSDGGSATSVVTSDTVDLTNMTTVLVDAETFGSNTSYAEHRLAVSTSKTPDAVSTSSTARNLRITAANPSIRTVHSLDVSTLSGLYYITFQSHDTSDHTGNGTIAWSKVYSIQVV